MNNRKVFNFPFIYLLFFIGLIVAFQQFYRYGLAFELGLNFRVIDLVNLLAAVLTFFKLLNIRYIKRSIFFNQRAVLIALAVYLLLGGIAAFRGYLIQGSWAIGVARYSLVEILLVPFIILSLRSEKQILILVKFVAVIVVTIWFSYLFANLDKIKLLMIADSTARYLDSQTVLGLACYSVMIMPFAIHPNIKKRIFSFIPVGLILISSFFFIILLQHRSVWVATFIGVFVAVFLSFTSEKNIGLLSRAIFILLLLALFFNFVNIGFGDDLFLTSLINDRLSFLSNMESDPTGYWRFRGWTWVINEVMSKNPWFGLGFRETGWVDWSGGAQIDVWEHNQYIHFFRAAGITGILSYLAFLAVLLIHSLKTIKRLGGITKLLAIGSFSSIIMNCVYMLFYNQVVFIWISAGLLLALSNQESEKRNK